VAASHGPRRIALLALGCRVSRSDGEALLASLGAGFRPALAGEAADWVVVNACTVTSDAASTTRQAVRRAGREHPGARIVVAGCHERSEAELLRGLPGVAAVVGARAHAALPGLLALLEAGDHPAEALRRAAASAPGFTGAPDPRRGAARPVLKVQDGCDERCSYCAVPAARGPSRSLPLPEALRRIASLGAERPEVVLSGVHLGAYGRDLAPRSSLAALVREAARTQAARRLRLSSLEPLEVPLDLLGEDAAGILCRHLHLPLQSGSDPVLKAMGRPYRAKDFAAAAEASARALPGACIGADVLTGFPGESEDDHRRTLAFVGSLPLAYLHVFPFSPRPGTAAARLADRPSPRVASRRAAELRELSRERWRSFLEAQVGRVLEVVVERVGPAYASGTSSEFAPVRLGSEGASRGKLVRVRVEGVGDGHCRGSAVDSRPGGASP